MSQIEYALIRSRGRWGGIQSKPPSAVMRVEKRTDASLLGSVLTEDGEEASDWSSDYDTRPSYAGQPWGAKEPPKRLRPGRVEIDRLLISLPTLPEALAALTAAKAAWIEAMRDETAANEAREAAVRAESALREEKQRLEEEMRAKLAELDKAASEAKMAASRVQAERYQRMSSAAIAAAEACRQAKAA